MITNQQIEELNEVIGYLNQAESLSDEDLVDKVENIRSLAKILTRIKITKIKSLLTIILKNPMSWIKFLIQKNLLFEFLRVQKRRIFLNLIRYHN